ncbi:MAG TPA: alkaline phosphatase, partial [Saprospiraceae bacterium]|nr:alkaline phosphatase [Saprospiraceae bacterium]
MDKIRKLILIHLVVVTVLFSCSILSFAGQAKNIILMIGDGMGPAHVQIAWLYATKQLGKSLAMTEVMDKGQTAYMVNDTADSTVTESAAAATQMATGAKVLAKSIGIGPDGKSLKTILELAKERGKATGLVTTSKITDATPAAFVAHVEHRSDEIGIADQ